MGRVKEKWSISNTDANASNNIVITDWWFVYVLWVCPRSKRKTTWAINTKLGT